MGFARREARGTRIGTRARLALVLVLRRGLAACGPWITPAAVSPQPPRKIQIMASDGWIYDVVGENRTLFEKETGIQVSFTIYAPPYEARVRRV